VSVFLSCIWRPVLASGLMYGAVVEISSVLRSVEAPAILCLLAGVAIGLGCYATLIALLWIATGRPAGTELMLWNVTRARLKRIFAEARS
jgi:hypothetical protein